MPAVRVPPLLILVSAVLVDMIGFGIVIPLLPFYAEEFGASPFVVTLLIASYAATQLLATPIWGRMSDRRGRRTLFIFGLAASSVSHLLYGFSNTLLLLFASRMTAGAAGGTISIAHAITADNTSEEDRAQGLGWIGAAAGLGVMLGPFIGGYFSSIWGLGAPGFIAAGLTAVNALAAYFFLPESRPRSVAAGFAQGEAATWRGWLGILTRYPLALMMGVYFLTISSLSAHFSVLALYLERVFAFDGEAVGYVMALSGACTVVVRGGILGWMVGRIGEPNTARFGVVFLGLGVMTVPLMSGPGWLLLAVPLWALGAGTLFPALATMVSRATDEHSQGSVLGGSQVVGGLGRVIGPVWAGLLFQSAGIATPYWVGVVAIGAAGVLALGLPPVSQLRRRVDPATLARAEAEEATADAPV
ncbi:MAG: MFS transporter [Gemmatimonadota bacterium]